MSFIKEDRQNSRNDTDHPSNSAGGDNMLTSTSFKVYQTKNQLEYLENAFQLIALMVRSNVARMKVILSILLFTFYCLHTVAYHIFCYFSAFE